MNNNYLITGYWGEPHVTAENDRGINVGIFGAGKFVLDVGKRFKAEYIGNNTVRMYDGKLMDNGSAAGIPSGEYIDLFISTAGQGMKRHDIIAFQYEQDTATMIERGSFVVIQGEESSGTAEDPALIHGDLLEDKTTFEQMPLWRVAVSGATIAAPVQVFELAKTASAHAAEAAEGALASAKTYTDNAMKSKAPVIKYGTTEVTDGATSTYPEGTLYVVI